MSVQLENGYTKIANELIEQLATLYLSPYEWQVLMAIFRKTYGFNKKSDWIANSQLVIATGIHKAHVSRTIKKLIKRNLVTQTGNKLSFNKKYSSWLPKQVTTKTVTQTGNSVTQIGKTVTQTGNSVTQIGNAVTQTGNSVTQIGGHKINSTKETYTKETLQKKKEREKISIYEINDSHFEVIADRYSVPMSFVVSKYDDMVNWHESTGRTKKDWIATLRNFVKKDAIDLRKDHHAKSKIDFISP